MTQQDLEKQFMGFKWQLKIPSNIDSEIAAGRMWEPVVTKWIQRNLKDGDIVLDVGANIGWFSLIMSAAVGSGLVFAMEPEPSFRARLESHITLNKIGNVRVSSSSLSHVFRQGWCIKNPGPYFSSARMIYDRSSLPEGHDEELVTEAWSVTLDDWWSRNRLDLIKIDIDGFEMEALLGGERTIKRLKPKIAIEIADQETVDLLISFGYNLWWERGMQSVQSADVKSILSSELPTINILAKARE